jgi:hypothetical protein
MTGAQLVQQTGNNNIDASLVDVFRKRNRACQPSFNILAARLQVCSEPIKPSYDVSSAKHGAGFQG